MKKKAFIILLLFIFVIPSCTENIPVPPDPEPLPGEDLEPEPEPEPDFDFALYQPNELGEIPIWMYHNILDPEGIWKRTPDNFRADLQRFYELGYRLVSLTDVINNNIAISAGTSPMVLTFDDGNASNFKLIKNEKGEIVVDPARGQQVGQLSQAFRIQEILGDILGVKRGHVGQDQVEAILRAKGFLHGLGVRRKP